MPVFKLTKEDHKKILDSPRHHFIHGNATVQQLDGSVTMTYSHNVARMLQQELGVISIFVHPVDHIPIEKEILQ